MVARIASQRGHAEVHAAVAVKVHDHDDVNVYVNAGSRSREFCHSMRKLIAGIDKSI